MKGFSFLSFLNSRRAVVALAMIGLAALFVASPAFASEASTGLEWEQPLDAIVDSITGPVAFGVSFIAMCACGMMLVWGGDLNEFSRRIVVLILVVAVIMFAGNMLRRMFAGGAAVVTPPAQVETVPPTLELERARP